MAIFAHLQKRVARARAIARSRGGWTTKIAALTDLVGCLFALMLTLSNVAELKSARAPPAPMGSACYVLEDKGYDTTRLYSSLRRAGPVPGILGRSSRKRMVRYDCECKKHANRLRLPSAV